MGTNPLKKKSVLPAASKKILIPGEDFDVGALRDLTEQTRLLADHYETVIEGLDEKEAVACPQRVMRVALGAPDLVEQAARFTKDFNAYALAHRLREGGFMHEAEEGQSLVVIQFPTSGGSITPKWKEEAFSLAAQLAEVKGEYFDVEKYEADVRKRTAPSKVSSKVELTEAG